jgi:hypothetical protein
MDLVGVVFTACGSSEDVRAVDAHAAPGPDDVRLVPIPDRRRIPERRALWRGGRRSTDRAEGGEAVAEARPLTQQLTGIWRWFSF